MSEQQDDDRDDAPRIDRFVNDGMTGIRPVPPLSPPPVLDEPAPEPAEPS